MVRRPRGRALTSADRALWEAVKRTVRPLKPGEAANVGEAGPADGEPAETAAPPLASPPAGRSSEARPVGARHLPALPPLSPIEPRISAALSRGRGIDARLDLHGMRQDEAHARLLGFLTNAQHRGHRLILVITGKGGSAYHGPSIDGRGVLRRLVPQWLAGAPFRPYVLGFAGAHSYHGGSGALYVRVRRRRAARGETS